jgi:archaetidylinositol phosphate synthase
MLSPLKSRLTVYLKPITIILTRAGITPNHLTFLGLVLGFGSAYLIATGNLMLGATFILLSGFMDMLDGALARNQNFTTEFGGFLDSVFDRYVDVAIFIGLGIYGISWVYVSLAMTGALLVSYTRARAENVIEKCDVGIAERGERLIILFIGIVTGNVEYAVILIAVLAHLTAVHRVYHTHRVLSEK